MGHQKSSSHKPTHKAKPDPKQDMLTGPNGVAMTPPNYGIDALDSSLIAPSMEARSPLTIQPKLTVTSG
jgi:hypothetical protein